MESTSMEPNEQKDRQESMEDSYNNYEDESMEQKDQDESNDHYDDSDYYEGNYYDYRGSSSEEDASQCVGLENGGEYVFNPIANQPSTTMIMHRLRMAIIDKFGVHLQSIGLLEIIQPEPEYLTSQCIYFPNDDARAKLMVVEGEFIPYSKLNEIGEDNEDKSEC